MNEFSVRITKGTKRIGEVHNVYNIREIDVALPLSSITESINYVKCRFYVLWIDGMETVLDPDDCEIVKPMNIMEFI